MKKQSVKESVREEVTVASTAPPFEEELEQESNVQFVGVKSNSAASI